MVHSFPLLSRIRQASPSAENAYGCFEKQTLMLHHGDCRSLLSMTAGCLYFYDHVPVFASHEVKHSCESSATVCGVSEGIGCALIATLTASLKYSIRVVLAGHEFILMM